MATAATAGVPHRASVSSEVGRLRTVLLHRPGPELQRLTPRNNADLLFDGLPWVARAQEEHDGFAGALRERGVEVLYLAELLAETLEIEAARAGLGQRQGAPLVEREPRAAKHRHGPSPDEQHATVGIAPQGVGRDARLGLAADSHGASSRRWKRGSTSREAGTRSAKPSASVRRASGRRSRRASA